MKRLLVIILTFVMAVNIFAVTGYATADAQLLINGENYSNVVVTDELGNHHLLADATEISYALQAVCEWDNDKKITIQKDGKTIVFTVDSETANVNGLSQKIETPSQIIDGAPYIPAEFLGKALDYHVFTEREGLRVRIVSKTSTDAPAVSKELIPGMAQLDTDLLKVHRPVPTEFTKSSELDVNNLIYAKTDYSDVVKEITRPQNPKLPEGEVILSSDGFITMMKGFAEENKPNFVTITEENALKDTNRITMNVKLAGQSIGEANNDFTPFTKSVRLNVNRSNPENLGAYPIWFYQAVPSPTVRDQYILTFWARLIDGGSTEAEKGAFRIQMPAPDWSKTIDETVEFGKEWTKFVFLLTGYKEADTLRILPTVYKQIIEIGGFEITDVGEAADVSYFDKEEDLLAEELTPYAPWRTEALERIEEIRKGDFKVIVQDSKGNPVKDAKVTFDMFEHDFKFGVQQDMESVEDVYWAEYNGLDGNGDKERELRERRGALFNSLSVGNRLKWQFYAKDKQNNPDLKSTAQVVIDKAQEDGIKYVRGHALWMPSNSKTEYPQELYDLLDSSNGTKDERYTKFKSILKEHFTEMNEKFPEIYEWDVTNETMQRPYFTNEFQSIQPNSDPNYIFEDVYEIAKETLTNGQKLMLCDNQQFEDHYWERLDWFKEHNIEYDSFGMQGHSRIGSKDPDNVYRPTKWLEVWDRFAYEYGKTFAVTEFSVGALNNEYGNAGQGDYMRDIMIAAFSHPACTGFNIWWMSDHWSDWNSPFAVDNYTNKEDGAGVSPLYTNKFKEKPGVAIFKDLLYNKWWTKGATAITDAGGMGTINGYYGDYDITVTVNGKQVKTQMAAFHKGYENVLTITLD